VGFFNLFNIIYTILPVDDLAPNHRVLKPGLEPQARAVQDYDLYLIHYNYFELL
jgi:hypothetical protein